MENRPLEQRTGRNIGVSPIFFSAYQQHVNAPFLKLESSDTVLWEGVKGCVRAPRGTKPKFCGLLLTKDLLLPDVSLDLFFVDERGNEFNVGGGFLPMGDGVGFVILDPTPTLGAWPFGLCPGEKILSRITLGNPNGKVTVVPYSKDFKSKGGGKGGLSDGGVLCLRQQVTLAGTTFTPKLGTSWEDLSFFGTLAGGGGAFGSLMLSNNAAVDADVSIFYVAPDGTEFPITPTAGIPTLTVPAGTIINVDADLGIADELAGYIQAPAGLRLKLASALPNGKRVDALYMVAENDIAPDLSEG